MEKASGRASSSCGGETLTTSKLSTLLERVPAAVLGSILVERYGLDGRGPRSLEEVAKRHRLTRLQVRLIEGHLVMALKGYLVPRAGLRAVAQGDLPGSAA